MAEENAGDFHSQLSYGTFLLEDGRPGEAVPYLEAAKRLFPEYAEIDSPYWHLAMIAKENGDIHRATEELSALTAINQNNYLANTELSALHEELGNLAAASEALDRAIYIYPFEIPTHQKLAGLYEKMENHSLAIRERKAVISLAPVDMAEALYLLAKAEFDAGDQVAARGSIIRSLEIAPGYPAAQELLLAIIGREKNP